MIDVEWVCPCEDHARLVMEWRNDPLTLAASFDQTPKTWPAFYREFQTGYFSTPKLPPLFALSKGKRVGFVRFRPVPQVRHPCEQLCEISLIVAPEARRQGFASRILQAVTPLVRVQGYDRILADIRPDNRASLQAFEKAGYQFRTRQSVTSPYNGETAEVLRYDLPLRCAPLSPDGVYVIAEAGSNWRMGTPERDWNMARALVDVAVEAGADAVKFQTYRPETVYVANAGKSEYLAEAGIKEEIRSIFQDLAMPYELVSRIAEYCGKSGIDFMTTPFSPEDFAATDPYVSAHKIASYEISHVRLLQLAARSGKPLVLSTGASTEADIAWAVDTFYSEGGTSLTLLQCTAQYPAKQSAMNLQVLSALKSRFGVHVGLSDHSRDPVLAPVSAVALGATVIEKHYTLDNRLPGPDHSFALLPGELQEMVRAIRGATEMRGSGVKEVLGAEAELASFARRGVQALTDICEGDRLVEGKNIAILRPGEQVLGVHPKHLCEIEGKAAQRKIAAGSGILEGDWNDR